MTSLARRAVWTAVDQALSSASNFVVAVLAARLLDRSGFGAFGVAFAVYLLALGVSRSVATDPLLVCHSSRPDPGADRAALGTAVVVGVMAGATVGAAGAALHGDLRGALWALAVCLPGLLLQDATRFVAFARGDPRWAAASDGAWVALEVAGMAAVASAAGPGGRAGLVVGAWGAAGAAAALVPLVAWRTAPALGRARSWVSTHGVLARRFAGEFAVTTGSGQVAVFAVAGLSSVAEAGAFRAGQVLLGPVNVAFMAAGQFAVPEGVRLRERDPAALVQGGVGLAGLMAIVAVGAGAAWSLVPARVGEALLGDAWGLGRSVVVPLAVAMAASGVASVAYWGLRVVDAADRSLRVRTIVVPLLVGAGAAGAAVSGARGAVVGMACAHAVAAVLAWRAFRGAWRADLARGGAVVTAPGVQPTGVPTTAS